MTEIADEKAGIIKPGVPVVSAPQNDEALTKITAVAAQRGTRLILAGRDWPYRRESFSLASQQFKTWPIKNEGDGFDWQGLRFEIPLLGAHQIENAVVAVAAAAELRAQGFNISPDAIQRGLKTVQWPGRFEVITDRVSGKTILLDCAHNRDSAAKLVEAAKMMQDHPMSLQMRYLQTLVEVASEKNSTTIFPIPIDLIEMFMKKKG